MKSINTAFSKAAAICGATAGAYTGISLGIKVLHCLERNASFEHYFPYPHTGSVVIATTIATTAYAGYNIGHDLADDIYCYLTGETSSYN